MTQRERTPVNWLMDVLGDETLAPPAFNIAGVFLVASLGSDLRVRNASLSWIANMTHLSRGTVVKHMRILQDHGWIKSVKHTDPDTGGFASNDYDLIWPQQKNPQYLLGA